MYTLDTYNVFSFIVIQRLADLTCSIVKISTSHIRKLSLIDM